MIAHEIPKPLRCGGCLWSMYVEVSPKEPNKVKYRCVNDACKESGIEYFLISGLVHLKEVDDARI